MTEMGNIPPEPREGAFEERSVVERRRAGPEGRLEPP